MDSYDIISLLHTLFCVKGTINKQAPLQTLNLLGGLAIIVINRNPLKVNGFNRFHP